MRSSIEWSDRIVDNDGQRFPIYCITFNPEGTQLLATCGTHILVYNAQTGELINTLKQHKDTIYAIDYSPDGKRFASGGADRQVIVWHSGMEGIVKYQHAEPIQAITHNPLTNHVTSVTSGEFGIWSHDQKSVNKFKAPAKITCCSWTRDGQFLALGLFTGSITIRNRSGDELIRIDPSQTAVPVHSPSTSATATTPSPIWSVSWNQYGADEPLDILAVTDWSQQLSLYQLNGKSMGKPRQLGFDPCTVSYYQKRYLLIGGSDKRVSMWTADGVHLGVVGEVGGWVWCARANPKTNRVAVGSNDGSITMFQVSLGVVHGLFKNRYAYRENMSDVVVQDLYTNRRTRIKCRDHVRKVAICRNQLAVQLSDRLVIYDQVLINEKGDWSYQVREKIKSDNMECNLLVVTSKSVLVCLDRNLQAFSFTGERLRQWRLDSLIRYIKVVGGPSGKEGLLVGLKAGQVYLVYVDNPFPILIYKHSVAVRCLDLSKSRSKLAIVDENNQCLLYDLPSKTVIAQESGAGAVAWNTDYEDMVCYSGNGYLNIKCAQFPTHRQQMQGFVVGFMGSKIFCLTQASVVTVDVPQAVTMERFMAAKQFPQAYETACLGVTEDEWHRLAMASLENYQLETSKKSFARLRDFKYLELISYLESVLRGSTSDNARNLCLAYYHAYLGQFKEAAALFRKAGEPQKAINMFADLNMWDSATKTATETSADKTDLLRRKARIQQDKNDLLSAARTFEEMGDYMQAIAIYAQLKLWDRMTELARSLNKIEIRALEKCAEHLLRNQQLDQAAEVLRKLDDIKRLLDIYVELQRWDDALALVEMYPNMTTQINLPYAHWLAGQERYREAQEYFRRAGRSDLSINVLRELAECAVEQNRFQDSAHYYWTLAQEFNAITLPRSPASHKKVDSRNVDGISSGDRDSFEYYKLLSLLYFAYGPVYWFTQQPFSLTAPSTLLNMSLFALKVTQSARGRHKRYLGEYEPPGISITTLLIAIGKLSQQLGAFKLARFVLDRLCNRHVLTALQRQDISRQLLIARGQPFTDAEQLSPICWQCGTVNPLLDRSLFEETMAAPTDDTGTMDDGKSDKSTASVIIDAAVADGCARCGKPFYRSLYSFDTLPVEEFRPADGISDYEAIELLGQPPLNIDESTADDGRRFTEEVSERVQRLQLHDADSNNNNNNNNGSDRDEEEEQWEKSLQLTLPRQSIARRKTAATLVSSQLKVLDRKAMESMHPKDVFIIINKTNNNNNNNNNPSQPVKFFKTIVPGVMSISKCEHCHQFYHTEDLEYLALQTIECPLCRNPWNIDALFGSAVNLASTGFNDASAMAVGK